MKTLVEKAHIKKQNDTYFILHPDIRNFGEQYLKSLPLAKLSYSTLFRFYLYTYLLRYEGKDEYIQYLKTSLGDSDEKTIEIIQRIPINNGILETLNKKFNFNFINTKDDDIEKLKIFDENIEKILTTKNLRDFTDVAWRSAKMAKDSEEVVRIMLGHIWKKKYNIIESDDKKNVDLWRINKETGERHGIKVKSVSDTVNFIIKKETIILESTLIEVPNYDSKFNEYLPFDYLVFFDRSHKALNIRTDQYESSPQIHILKSNAIHSILIDTSTGKRNVIFSLKSWVNEMEFFDKIYRTYNVPFKFTGKKFAN